MSYLRRGLALTVLLGAAFCAVAVPPPPPPTAMDCGNTIGGLAPSRCACVLSPGNGGGGYVAAFYWNDLPPTLANGVKVVGGPWQVNGVPDWGTAYTYAKTLNP